MGVRIESFDTKKLRMFCGKGSQSCFDYNEKSVSREPAFTVATYSAFLIASVLSYGDTYSK